MTAPAPAPARAVAAVAGASEILFEEGIIGVPRARRFELLAREGSPFGVLRCLDLPGFALPVVDTALVDPDYRPAIAGRVAATLGLTDGQQAVLLAVTSLESEGPTANLRAPLVINPDRRRGVQVILDNRTLPLRAPLRQAR